MVRRMRLGEMQHRLESYLSATRLSYTLRPNGQLVCVSGADAMRFALAMIEPIEALTADVKLVKENELYRLIEGAILDKSVVDHFNIEAGRLINHGSSILEALRQVAPRVASNTIAIKLPPVSTCIELEAFISKLRIGLDHHTRLVLGDGLTLEGFDTGTEWLVFAANSSQVLGYVFGFLAIAVKLRREQLLLRGLQAELESRAGYKAAVVEMAKANASAADGFAQALVSDLVATHITMDPDSRHEALNSAMTGMQALMDLTAQGAEIHRALNAPEAIRQLLPEPLSNKVQELKRLTESSESPAEKQK